MEFLIIFDRDTKTTRTAFFTDMEKGMQREEMLLWESREAKAKSSHVFSEKEISDLIAQVAEHIEKARHPGSALPNTGA